MSGPAPADRPAVITYGDTVDRATLVCPCGLRETYGSAADAEAAGEVHEREHAARAGVRDDGPLEGP